MKICKIGMIAIISFMSFYNKFSICATEDHLKDQGYFVKRIECSPLPENCLCLDLKFSEPEKSLDRIRIINSLKFNLTQYYRISSNGDVHIHDLREDSQWKPVKKPSLNYTYHLKNENKFYKGTKENIFDAFTQEPMESGDYIMNINFNGNNVDFTFSALSESNKKL